MVLESNLVEILLSVVLMFNVGAYSFLWYKIRQEEQDKEKIRSDMNKLRESVNNLWNRIFGREEDETTEGHLVETQKRFDDIDSKLDELCRKMDDMKSERVQEHQEVREQMRRIAKILDEEEQISAEKSDILQEH